MSESGQTQTLVDNRRTSALVVSCRTRQARLAILNDRPSRPPWPVEPVDTHYADHVVGGPGTFMMTVDGFAVFAAGIRRKLVREIAGRAAPPRHQAGYSSSASNSS